MAMSMDMFGKDIPGNKKKPQEHGINHSRANRIDKAATTME